MADLEAEVLADMESNPETYLDTAEKYLVIDNDLRTITIPAGITIIGVESDDGVNRLHFKMPRTYGEFDLSEFTIRINFMNRKKVNGIYVANAYKDGTYLVDDAEVDGDYIKFSWLVGRNAVKYMGDTKFIVCLKKTDSDGIVVKEFNTSLAILPSLEGLEVGTPEPDEDDKDVIAQLLAITEAKSNEAVQAVEDAKTQALEEIAQAGGVAIDDTLTESGKAADAKVVGDKFSQLSEEIGDMINFQNLEPYESFTVVTDSGDVVEPEEPEEPDVELTYQTYVGYGEDLMLQYDMIRQYELGKPTSTSVGIFTDVSGNDFPTLGSSTLNGEFSKTYFGPNSNGYMQACDCSDETLINTLNEANQITIEFIAQRVNNTTNAGCVAGVDRNQNGYIIFSDGTMSPYGVSTKYGESSLDCASIKHNTVTFDGATWKMYSEGELIKTYASNTALSCFMIGCLGYRSYAQCYNMYFNAMRVYKRALTEAEVKTNYNIDIARFGTVNVEVSA